MTKPHIQRAKLKGTGTFGWAAYARRPNGDTRYIKGHTKLRRLLNWLEQHRDELKARFSE